MNVTVSIPDDLARRLGAGGDDVLARRALEAFAVEEYRSGRVSLPELRQLLGFETRAALDLVLKSGEIYAAYDTADLEAERRDLARLGL